MAAVPTTSKRIFLVDLPRDEGALKTLTYEGVEVVPLSELEELAAYPRRDGLSLLIAACGLLSQKIELLKKIKEKSKGEAWSVLAKVGSQDRDYLLSLADYIQGFVNEEEGTGGLLFAVNLAFSNLKERSELERLRKDLEQRTKEVEMLNTIGASLSAERDIHRLLDAILTQSRQITGADAGSLYLVEPHEGETGRNKRLRFVHSQNDSLSLSFSQFTLEINKHSIAGYVALTGEILNLSDVYHLPAERPFSFNPTFDQKVGYKTKAVLTVPMINHKDEIIGVLQLINRKSDLAVKLASPEIVDAEVTPFDQQCERLALSLASQAAVALENSQLYESIQRLFEGFVTASVQAIEARDPTTAGHSSRVADFTSGLAERVDRADDGLYRDIHFTAEDMREIRYAALLHDFGKIGVREHVLVKGNKLFEHELSAVMARFDFIKVSLAAEYSRKILKAFMEKPEKEALADMGPLEWELKNKQEELEEDISAILEANKPTVLFQGGFEKLNEIAQKKYKDIQGHYQPYLKEYEAFCLSIGKGSLTTEERREIESHVSQTYTYLSKIPWTQDLRKVPYYAYGHHEKLDGRGYPNRLRAPDIPLQTRMMTIADIFDALTAADRPYKRAVSVDRALDILNMETKDGQIDQGLLDLFIQQKVYQLGKKA